jgi:signal transduction histidine kinase
VSDPGELRALCSRLVLGALGERRRIERALHDGAQQDLVAVSVRLQLLRELLTSDTSAALELLDELQRDVRDALDRLQTLASEIYPSLLAARGLPDALREAARTAGESVRVNATGLRRYPTEIEAAVYFACRAVLDGVPADARATLDVCERDGELRLELAGVEGVDPVGVEDFVVAAGGTLRLEPAADGARLTAAIPLSYESASAR